MFEYKTTAKTINEAVENGLKALNLEKKDVEIKVIKSAKNFQNAVVMLCVNDEIVENNEQIKRLKSLQSIENQISMAEHLLEKNKVEKDAILKSLSTNLLQKDGNALNQEQIVLTVKNFVDGIVEAFGIKNFDSVLTQDVNRLKISITGQHLQQLIGFKGKTLASVQFLANVFASKFDRNLVVYVDINGYKQQKEQKVATLAQQVAQQVQESGEPQQLPPMNAFERRVVHSVVAQFEDLATESVGEEPNRSVIIKKIK